MKKFLLGFAAFIIVSSFWLIATPAHAIVTVEDEEWYFTEGEIEFLEDDYQDALFNYYMLIIPYLDDYDIAEEAEALIADVEHDGYDAAIVFSWEDGEIYMRIANDSELGDVLDAYYSGDAVTAFLEDVFIPVAEDYSIAEGLVAIVEEFDYMAEELAEGSGEGQMEGGTGAGESAEADSQGESVPEKEKGSAEGIEWGKTLLYIIIFGLLVASAFLIFAVLRKRKIAQQIEIQIAQQNHLLSEVLAPYNKSNDRSKMSKGRTEEAFKVLTEQLFSVLTRVKEREKQLTALSSSVPLLKAGPLHEELFYLDEDTGQDERELLDLQEQLNHLIAQEMSTSKQLADWKELLDQLSEASAHSQEKYGTSIHGLQAKLERVERELAKAVELDQSFDFLGASRRFNELEKMIGELMTEAEQLGI